jgi:hypothetical protein
LASWHTSRKRPGGKSPFRRPRGSDPGCLDRHRAFILANSAVAFLAARLAGQTVADGTPIYAIGSLAGAAVGTAIGLSWVSPRMIRVVLAAILLASSLRMLAG